MKFSLNCTSTPLEINNLQDIETPRLVVFENRVQHNIKTMQEQLDSVGKEYDLGMLCPHVKTHKSSWVTKQLLEHGVSYFKCTPNEVDLLAEQQVPEIFVAYPLLPNTLKRLAKLVKISPKSAFHLQVSSPEHIEMIAQIDPDHELPWRVYIDLDVGMARTGIKAEQVLDLYHDLEKHSLSFIGLHAYDGHNHSVDAEERLTTSKDSVKQLLQVVEQFKSNNIEIERIMMAGTPGFLTDLQVLHQHSLDSKLYLSPGTWIYHDTSSAGRMQPGFEIAAFVLAQVIDKPSSWTITLNLGHKRWSIDSGPPVCLSLKDAKITKWSEEHTIVTLPDSTGIEIGRHVLIAPQHVCSTVNLWENMLIIDRDGKIKKQSPIDARNR